VTPPKVLIGIVTYEGKDYVWDKFWSNIKNLSYDNYDIMITDNSPTKKYYSKLKKRLKHEKNVTIKHVNRGDTSREAQAKCLNLIRDKVLKEDYDYFMCIESDLIPPRDIIERLMSHNLPSVGCIYLIGYADSDSQPPRPCLFGLRPGKDGNDGIGTYNLPPAEGFGMFGTGVKQIHGCGLGATLIKRNILERIRFWYDLREPVKHSDVLYYMDIHNEGIPNYVDTDLIIPHYNSKWDDVTDK